MSNEPEREVRCFRCEKSFPSEYCFCPHCGIVLQDSDGDPVTEYEARFAEVIDNDIEAERSAIRLWRPSWGRLLVLGLLLLSLPDMAILIIFLNRVSLSPLEIAQFIALDALIGMAVVMVAYSGAQRGFMGDLLLAALRMGQMPLIYAAKLVPFQDGILGLMLLVMLPLAVLAVCALILDLHLTDLMDFVARLAPYQVDEEGAEGGRTGEGEAS